MLITQQMFIETGRFPAALPLALTVVGGVAMALALACLPCSIRLRFGSLALLTLATVALPISVLVVFRWHTGIPLNVHDGMFQTEIVTNGMLHGKDPYGTDFTRTALMQWFHYTPDGAAVAHHYIYYPLVVLASMPVVVIERGLGLATDLRPMLLLVGVLAFVLIVGLPWSWQARYTVAVILFLNPFFAWLEGRNDILWLTPILLTNVVSSRQSPFPFVLLQAVLVLAVCVIGARQLWRDAGVANVLGTAATVLSVIILCRRFTNDSYLAAMIFPFGLAIATGRHVTRARLVSLEEAA